MSAYTVYILACADGTLYTGVTTDMDRRLAEHNGLGGKGAKYTKARRPVRLAYSETCPDRSSAQKREHAIRKLGRQAKRDLVSQLKTATV